jgi:hypothetical protein
VVLVMSELPGQQLTRLTAILEPMPYVHLKCDSEDRLQRLCLTRRLDCEGKFLDRRNDVVRR